MHWIYTIHCVESHDQHMLIVWPIFTIRLKVLSDTSTFVSFSDDGSTKLWELGRLEGKTIVNKPKTSYGHQGGRIKAGTFCQSNKSIAAASTNGSLQVFK